MTSPKRQRGPQDVTPHSRRQYATAANNASDNCRAGALTGGVPSSRLLRRLSFSRKGRRTRAQLLRHFFSGSPTCAGSPFAGIVYGKMSGTTYTPVENFSGYLCPDGYTSSTKYAVYPLSGRGTSAR
jgi:hypothetical protein